MSETSEKTLPVAPAKPRRAPPKRHEPEGLSKLAREHPGLAIGGGLALGVIVGALLPRGTARRLAQGVIATAALGGEASLALGRHAREGARNVADETAAHMREFEEHASDGARRLRKTTAVAAGTATSAGLDLARAGLRLLTSFRR